MKFLVPIYSCLKNPWLGGYRPQIPVLSSVLTWVCWTPPEQNSWERHCLIEDSTNEDVGVDGRAMLRSILKGPIDPKAVK